MSERLKRYLFADHLCLLKHRGFVPPMYIKRPSFPITHSKSPRTKQATVCDCFRSPPSRFISTSTSLSSAFFKSFADRIYLGVCLKLPRPTWLQPIVALQHCTQVAGHSTNMMLGAHQIISRKKLSRCLFYYLFMVQNKKLAIFRVSRNTSKEIIMW